MTVLPVPDEDMLAQASAEAADAKDAFVVDLEGYEGPLHLLLDLARRHKIDLVKISILQLADQYLAICTRGAGEEDRSRGGLPADGRVAGFPEVEAAAAVREEGRGRA
jgi:hypothetical protein